MGWIQNRFRAFQASYDPVEILAGSTPAGILVAAGGMTALTVGLAYLPGVAEAADLRRPWIGVVLAVLAGLLTTVVYLRQARGVLGTLSTLLDTAFYSACLVYLATNTQGEFAVGLAITHAIMLLAFQTRVYALSLLFALVLALPTVAGLLLYTPSGQIGTILVGTWFLAVGMSSMTAARLRILERQRKLEQALRAADRVAEDNLQAALTVRLLSLGSFLHELRNQQAVVAAALTLAEMTGKLDEKTQEALAMARAGLNAQQDLVTRVLEELRQHSGLETARFRPAPAIAHAVGVGHGLQLTSPPAVPDCLLRGSSEHFGVVLDNLLRNAYQAGAQHACIETELDADRTTLELRVLDDGPGITEERRAELFTPFASSRRAGGTGLGLYLCRRYVELMGGSIQVGASKLGGAEFTLRIPVVGGRSDPAPARAGITDAEPVAT